MYAMFRLAAHPGCEDCPPEKPEGCSAHTRMSGINDTSTENPDGTWTCVMTAGEGASSTQECSECYGEEPL